VRGRAWTSILVVSALAQPLATRHKAGNLECLISLSSSTIGESNQVMDTTINPSSFVLQHAGWEP